MFRGLRAVTLPFPSADTFPLSIYVERPRKPLIDTLPGLKAGVSIPASTCNAGLRQTDSQSTGVFRLRVSLGDDSQTFGSHVPGGVPVPQVVRSTPQTGPLPLGERKVVLLIPAFRTELGRWKEPVHLNKVLAVPPGFVFHLAQQLSEGGIHP